MVADHGLARAAIKASPLRNPFVACCFPVLFLTDSWSLQVTHDALSPKLLRDEIEVYSAPVAADLAPGVGGVTLGEYKDAKEIVVTATAVRFWPTFHPLSMGLGCVDREERTPVWGILLSPLRYVTQPGLKAGKVTIKVSADAEIHAVLAVAKASVESDLRFE